MTALQTRPSQQALPITLGILQRLAADLTLIGMDPIQVLASFSELFGQALEAIGFEPAASRRILASAAARAFETPQTTLVCGAGADRSSARCWV